MTATKPSPAPTAVAELPWEARFVEALPGDAERGNFTRRVRSVAYSETAPTPVAEPRLLGWSAPLGAELGIARPTASDAASVEILGGSRVLPSMRPYAARYGGHQFGHWAGQLGDGRAITLGELRTPSGERVELQLKGAGPTPYSRRGDGRAVLRSSVREFLCSEAMHALGVPTTRALSLVGTGEDVVRDMFYDGHPKAEPGAVVCRVAPSFLRFGNFEILSDADEVELLRRVTDLLIADHYPELARGADVYGRLLDEIARRTAVMVAHWMRVGFVHGVMNTDNMSALGLTIDYGPYGWLEPFDNGWTPNTTDAEGRRYRFGNQPDIALWNVARLAEALAPLIGSEERLQQSLEVYRDTFVTSHTQMLAQKLGLASIGLPEDQALLQSLFQLMGSTETDYTIFFRALCDWNVAQDPGAFVEMIKPAFYVPDDLASGLAARWRQWAEQYGSRLAVSGIDVRERVAVMKRVNPKYVLRNYLAQNAINALTAGDASYMERLFEVLMTPYDEHPGAESLAERRPEWARHAPGCSALSCSS